VIERFDEGERLARLAEALKGSLQSFYDLLALSSHVTSLRDLFFHDDA
jgi:hypothetical protein